MPVTCILCQSTDTSVTESIDTSQICELYRKRGGIDVSRFFSTPTIDLCSCNACGLKFYHPPAIGDGSFYDELQQYPDYYMEEKAEFREASKWISENDDVLEIGSGSGNFANSIRCKSYTGLEFSESAIRTAKKNGLNVFSQDLEEHALSHAGKYDIVCYFQVLEHVENPGAFISASVACLKPGGRLLLAVPSEDSFINKVVNFYLNMPPHHTSRYTDAVLQKIALLNGLKLLAIIHEPLNTNHRTFYLKTNIYHRLSSIFRLRHKSVDNSLRNRLFYVPAVLLSYVLLPALSVRKNIVGQSVIAVYQK